MAKIIQKAHNDTHRCILSCHIVTKLHCSDAHSSTYINQLELRRVTLHLTTGLSSFCPLSPYIRHFMYMVDVWLFTSNWLQNSLTGALFNQSQSLLATLHILPADYSHQTYAVPLGN